MVEEVYVAGGMILYEFFQDKSSNNMFETKFVRTASYYKVNFSDLPNQIVLIRKPFSIHEIDWNDNRSRTSAFFWL
ncbi:hypothetical protein [Chryseobacterium sp.]|jgi:hypothetical protein|uniref:hypothetical protein n=1 Tax=Chryseobacterium sp. TaxID=1871047 RepID=UPI00289EA054|nr:hypothetical protein [Chryseobacterium sp.]